MKNYKILSLFLILITILGCNTKPKGPSHLSVGKSKLIKSGLALESINHLKEAEKIEEDRSEARALLVIAYSHGLATEAAKSFKREAEFIEERKNRIAAMDDTEINKLIEIISKQSQVQKSGLNALAEKGTEAAVQIVDHIVKKSYPDAQQILLSLLIQIGPDAVNPILDRINDAQINSSEKIKLISVIGDIGDKTALEKLQSIDTETMNSALRMEILTTLYRLGDEKHKSEITKGLTSDNVGVRRASAKAMRDITNVNENILISSLKDTDTLVVSNIAKALSVHKTKNAVKPLADILKSQHGKSTKQAVINTLTDYTKVKSDLSRGLAKHLAEMLINQEVSNAEDRVRVVQLLKNDSLVKQLKALRLVDDIDSRLYDYSQKYEDSSFVKTELNNLFEQIRK
ncbi:HEAT repeat domain-containing protein [Candidatus Poribacteria bacterium]|nr:HEAT repeat domain-containing protein [Candidatus Poribacteria bacterium]